MSSQTPSLTPEQEKQQLLSQLSAQFKSPLRNIMGESEEAVQTTISTLIQQIVKMHELLKDANEELIKLKKLCDDNKITDDSVKDNVINK